MFFSRAIKIVGLALLLLGVPRLAGLLADRFDYSRIDPDGAFAWISVHHIVQALIFLAIMIFAARRWGLHFGFGWGNRVVGWKWVRIFALIFAAYVVVSLLLVMATGTFQYFPYPLTARNITGQLGFQLLLSGPSEELIFRAFAITLLGLWIKGGLFRGTLSHATIIAAVIFALAHVGVSFAPFALSYHPFQLVYAFALGLAYGACYEQSKSMIYPMIMHSMSNVVAVGVSILASYWFPPGS
ncbi:MAG: CPBP family intramembrane metalloprotease [Natronospirillum sp.]|uniref:CPBP family intramembrane glutamic endopeptidase n=1 Tax=Natronospirillum sp. TaxID=2812955 RepID=UPI0025ED5DF9|nr:CPBP family intramembrane glutamic endopeptidase [Natronospirillum sp.]MCH8552905.1 CPBP family intramembrane metalloprotease [Natronospirillum sp.]